MPLKYACTFVLKKSRFLKVKGHHKYKHGRTAQKYAHIPVFSKTFDKIPVYSRRGILIIKFQYFPGCV